MKKVYEKPDLNLIKMSIVDNLAFNDPNMSNTLEDEFDE